MTGTASQAWRDAGFFEVHGLLPSADVEHLRATFAWLEAAGVAASQQQLYTHEVPCEPRPPFTTLMRQWINPRRVEGLSYSEVTERLQRSLRELVGERLTLFQDVLMSKRPEHAPFPWHQDEPFWPVSSPTGVVVWCALDPVDADNGALEIAPGSHRLGLGPAIDLHTGAPQRGVPPGEMPVLTRLAGRSVALGPGDAVLFHPRTWHRSGRNLSGALRRIWSSSWVSASARWDFAAAPRHPMSAHVRDGAPVDEALAEERS